MPIDAHQLDPLTDQAAQAFLERLAGRFDVASAILFGSRARQQHRPNDHDPAGVAPKYENRSHGYTRMDTDVF